MSESMPQPMWWMRLNAMRLRRTTVGRYPHVQPIEMPV